jgi:hypothetical protein
VNGDEQIAEPHGRRVVSSSSLFNETGRSLNNEIHVKRSQHDTNMGIFRVWKRSIKMACVELMVWMGSGVALVPLLQLLKQLPKVGAIIGQYAWLLTPVIAAILPQLAALASPMCAKIDPLLWAVIYAALTYLVSQVVYYLSKYAVPSVGKAMKL